MSENDISKILVDIFYRLHKNYGPGLFESVYEELVAYELVKTGLNFRRQYPVPLIHETIKLEVGFRADLMIENKVIVELKSVEALCDIHYKQVLTYLKLAGIKLGLLVNFNVPLIKGGIHRIVNNL